MVRPFVAASRKSAANILLDACRALTRGGYRVLGHFIRFSCRTAFSRPRVGLGTIILLSTIFSATAATNLPQLVIPSSNITPTNNTNALRAIKPPVEIPSGWAWVGWTLLALAAAALLFWAWHYWQKKRQQVPVVPVVPPHVRAKQRLQEALALISQPRPFCIAVSDTLRLYLEERFDFRAPERTTEEFLYELQSTNLLTASQKDRLREFLERCDLVKFAKYEPREPELRGLHDSALKLVEETEPRPVVAPGATILPPGTPPAAPHPAPATSEAVLK